jgi:hypothetical protein
MIWELNKNHLTYQKRNWTLSRERPKKQIRNQNRPSIVVRKESKLNNNYEG